MKVSELTVFTFLGACAATACVTVNEDKGDNSSANGGNATAGASANTAGIGGQSNSGGTTQSNDGGGTTQSNGGDGNNGGDSGTGGTAGVGEITENMAGCRTLFSLFCDKVFGCFDADQLDPNSFGNNKEDCKTKLTGTNCTAQKTKCGSGKEYQPSVAQECLDQFDALSCDQLASEINGLTEPPTACDDSQLCQ